MDLPAERLTFQPYAEYLEQTTSEADKARDDAYRQVVGEPRPPTSRPGRFVCGSRSAPIGQASWLLGGIARERAARVIAPVRRPRRRGAGRPGHRRTTRTRAGPSDSDGDGPGDAGPPARRRVVVDERYLVVRMAAA